MLDFKKKIDYLERTFFFLFLFLSLPGRKGHTNHTICCSFGSGKSLFININLNQISVSAFCITDVFCLELPIFERFLLADICPFFERLLIHGL